MLLHQTAVAMHSCTSVPLQDRRSSTKSADVKHRGEGSEWARGSAARRRSGIHCPEEVGDEYSIGFLEGGWLLDVALVMPLLLHVACHSWLGPLFHVCDSVLLLFMLNLLVLGQRKSLGLPG
jgi:hypothetical protein